MKALKNDSTLYVEQITSAITDCYCQNAEPTDAELMALYGVIGKNICVQGETAFVVHLAEQLSQQFPLLNGFSPRNLRRMRDFHRTYENSSSLMSNAQTLSWTQNTVILECCDTNEQRTFYIGLAAEKNLSKLALMKAIEEKALEAAMNDKTSAQNVPTACAVVGDADPSQTVNTAQANKTACGAFVTACEQPRQGESAPSGRVTVTSVDIGEIPKKLSTICEADAGQLAHRATYSYQAQLPFFSAQTDRGKPPNPFRIARPPIKNKNALPDGRTHSKSKWKIPRQMPRAA